MRDPARADLALDPSGFACLTGGTGNRVCRSVTAGCTRRDGGAAHAMTRQYELVERVKSYEPDADEALLNRAYVYAMKAHGNQKRASGAPFFSHPLEVAAILAEMRLDDATIATALLHDTIEDTGATRERDRRAVRRRDRLAGRRPHQDQEARPRHQEGRAGGELPQAPARHLERHPRAAGQARRPAAQHAHARRT